MFHEVSNYPLFHLENNVSTLLWFLVHTRAHLVTSFIHFAKDRNFEQSFLVWIQILLQPRLPCSKVWINTWRSPFCDSYWIINISLTPKVSGGRTQENNGIPFYTRFFSRPKNPYTSTKSLYPFTTIIPYIIRNPNLF